MSATTLGANDNTAGTAQSGQYCRLRTSACRVHQGVRLTTIAQLHRKKMGELKLPRLLLEAEKPVE
jgi:hypothetical protein